MAYPTFTLADLADYSGRPEASYTSYTTQALAQASLLFKFASCLTDWPSDADEAELAKYAILSLADIIFLSQPFAATLATPFISETIGSYSYSKAVNAIRAGTPLGISWFDLAVERLGICEIEGPLSSDHGSFTEGFYYTDSDGYKQILGPEDFSGDPWVSGNWV